MLVLLACVVPLTFQTNDVLDPCAAPCGVPVCVLPCGSAQLGQPFALLRAAAVGLRSAEFGEDHALVRAVERAGRSEGHERTSK